MNINTQKDREEEVTRINNGFLTELKAIIPLAENSFCDIDRKQIVLGFDNHNLSFLFLSTSGNTDNIELSFSGGSISSNDEYAAKKIHHASLILNKWEEVVALTNKYLIIYNNFYNQVTNGISTKNN